MLTLMTFRYYFFAVLFAFIYQLLGNKLQRKHLLFIINMLFVAMIFFISKKHYLFLMVHLSFSYILIRLLQQTKDRILIPIICLLVAFIPLIFFKYSLPQNFIIEHFKAAAIFLKPATFIGISFYTFRISSVMIDIIYGRIIEKINIFHFFNFATFFPCLLSGPLDRFSRFIADIDSNKEIYWQTRYDALFRIVLGIVNLYYKADVNQEY